MLISHEELFLGTIQDLRTKIQSGKPYDLIRACGLCRHLLIENHPLTHEVNRKRKVPLTFHIADFTNVPLTNKGSKTQGGFRDIQPRTGNEIVVKVDAFLNTRIMHSYGHEYKVREIIIAASHYFGGIHSGKPEKNQQFLTQFDLGDDFEMKNSFLAIRSICKVILKAMEPLEAAINGHTPTGGFSPQSSAD